MHMGMDLEKQRLSIEAAKLYYQSDYSQQDIASRLGVSRPTVSRLLQYAKDRGYVRIEIMDPLEDIDIIGGELKAKYNLETALVCFAPLKSDEEIQKHISKRRGLFAGHRAGCGHYRCDMGNNNACRRTSTQTQAGERRRSGTAQRGVSHSHINTYAADIVHLFAEAFHTVPRYLPLPVIFDNIEVKKWSRQTVTLDALLSWEDRRTSPYLR